MKTAWAKQTIPAPARVAEGGSSSNPKEKTTKPLNQFRSIVLLNVEGKIYFSVMVRRMTTYPPGHWINRHQLLPPLQSYMDDITCLLQTAPCMSRLLRRLNELISWARMKLKPGKSRSLSLRNGERNGRATFTVGEESLGREYTYICWD